MSQEWDYPPRRQQWREEQHVRPARQPRFQRVIDHAPKPKTAWEWYRKQMLGNGSFLYKANVSAIAFTAWGAAFAGIAIAACLLTLLFIIPASAADVQIADVDAALTSKAKELGYKITFRSHNCQMGEKYVCDINAFTNLSTTKIMAQGDTRDAKVNHFTMVFSGGDMGAVATQMSAYSVLLSTTSGELYQVDEASSLLADAVGNAKKSGDVQKITLGAAFETVSVLQGIGAVIVIGDSDTQ